MVFEIKYKISSKEKFEKTLEELRSNPYTFDLTYVYGSLTFFRDGEPVCKDSHDKPYYVGDWILENLSEWLRGIPIILSGKKFLTCFSDQPTINNSFIPKEDKIEIIFEYPDYPDIESKKIIVSITEFVHAVFNVCEELLAKIIVNQELEKNLEIIQFKENLKNAKKAFENYKKRQWVKMSVKIEYYLDYKNKIPTSDHIIDDGGLNLVIDGKTFKKRFIEKLREVKKSTKLDIEVVPIPEVH